VHFEFEYEDGQGKWQPVGTGEGASREEALKDLERRGSLAAGRYRSLPMDGQTETWNPFVLNLDKTIQPED